MVRPFTDVIALATIILWPLIPLFWIPVHCLPRFFKQIGFFTYVLPVLLWPPVAYLIYSARDVLLRYTVDVPPAMNVTGWILLIAGIMLQLWTILLLTLPGIMGMPQVTRSVPGKMATTGPFSVIRHPTYLSHTLMFLGVFLVSGITAAGIIALLDMIVVNLFIIPLEERELLTRFGEAYEQYREQVPSRMLPWRRKR